MKDTTLRKADWLAEYLDVPLHLIYQWRYRKQGPPAIKLTPGTLRWRQCDVDEWLDAQREQPHKEDPPPRLPLEEWGSE